MKAKIDEIVDALDFQSDEIVAVLHKETGNVLEITDEFIQLAEDEDDKDRPEWMTQPIADARHYLDHPEQYLELPSQWDVHEYNIMEDFCFERDDKTHKDRLLQALKGKGAFRRFKDTASNLELLDTWYSYRSRALSEIAITWCKENNVAYVENETK